MDFSEKWGQSIEDATNLALKDLGVKIDEVEVTVLEEPSNGFFGIGKKLALVRVEKKKTETKVEEPVKEVPKETIRKTKPEPKKEVKAEPKVKEKVSRETNNINRTEFKKDPKKLNSTAIRKPENLEPVESNDALVFLKATTEKMGLELSFTAFENDDNIYVDISGKDAGTIIGKRGQTLDSIQYLTSLVVNKNTEGYKRVIIDAENYREKREKTLEQLARRLASKVVKSSRSVRLEPMNPYERMVIHATLQDDAKVGTRSEGEEPYRRVIIELKK